MNYTYSRGVRRLALVGLCVLLFFILIRLKYIMSVLKGNNIDSYLIIILFVQLILFPGIFFAAYLWFRKISISADNSGMSYATLFKQVRLPWREIEEVRKCIFGSIKVSAGKVSVKFYSMLEPEGIQNDKTVHVRIKSIDDNLLLQEIKLKAGNAHFVGFSNHKRGGSCRP